ncbi:hypothetical protein MHH52_15620 [Paenibacillus sp. FSL K6-0276]|uniref:hypothetical protein n=1 Tax=Paenibacillus sp. FSL K6-0276 TaxID=2921450 RepID=UPI0030EC803A
MRFIQLPVELSKLKIAREGSHMILQHLRDLESTRSTLLLSLSFIGFFLQIISIILPVSHTCSASAAPQMMKMVICANTATMAGRGRSMNYGALEPIR